MSDDPRRDVLDAADRLRWDLPQNFRDRWVEQTYAESERLASAYVRQDQPSRRLAWERRLDAFLTNRWTGYPTMVLMLAVVLWITISGANVPSELLATLLVDRGTALWHSLFAALHAPAWLSGLLIDGIWLTTAWVVAVMLPPMAIFFPLFTLLEDFGYLPRVAFNLDSTFKWAGAHGKQALTMTMGFGCNAAGVVATRVIDSPRERLIAILTNNFSLCNGRWPTQIVLATIFIGVLVPSHLSQLVATSAVLGIALLGVVFMFGSSWLLSRTVLRGEASTFSLELPPYRPPRVLQTLYTSLIDRTLIVLWRAIVFAAPAGALLWLITNIHVGGLSIAEYGINALQPLGWLMGLNGVILLAYVVAIPANEIVIPTIIALTTMTTAAAVGAPETTGVIYEFSDQNVLKSLLVGAGWTTLTAVCLMLFSLLHNPCSTTLYTIYKETHSAKWTTVAALMPIAFGIVVCSLVALVWRALGGS